MKNMLEFLKSIVLMVGLFIFICLWIIIVFFMWIYDAICGGWYEKK